MDCLNATGASEPVQPIQTCLPVTILNLLGSPFKLLDNATLLIVIGDVQYVLTGRLRSNATSKGAIVTVLSRSVTNIRDGLSDRCGSHALLVVCVDLFADRLGPGPLLTLSQGVSCRLGPFRPPGP